jgi:hypothetical protein
MNGFIPLLPYTPSWRRERDSFSFLFQENHLCNMNLFQGKTLEIFLQLCSCKVMHSVAGLQCCSGFTACPTALSPHKNET